jgi:ubiquinone biosynthesis protein UbiJ
MLTEKIQSAIDREVAGSPRAQQVLRDLEGRSLEVCARHTPWQIRLQAAGSRLQIMRNTGAGNADARILGTPLALLALAREPMEVIRRGDVRIEGDAVVAEKFQELATLLRPDLEEALSRVVGDIPAHGVGTLLRSALAYGKSSARTAALNVGEYLTHEKQELVSRAEAERFLRGVDDLRDTIDRLAARISQLESPESGQ